MKLLNLWAEHLNGVHWLGDDRLTADCPVCKSANSLQARQNGSPAPLVRCLKGCKSAEITECLKASTSTSKPASSTIEPTHEDPDPDAIYGSSPEDDSTEPPPDETQAYGSSDTYQEPADAGGAHYPAPAASSGSSTRKTYTSTNEDTLRRVPPQDIAAEQSVLGAILLDNEAIETALRIIKTEDFYRESHRLIFKAMRNLWSNRIGIDAVTLKAELTRTKELDAIGGMPYILELAEFVPTAAHTEHYANIIKSHAGKREFIARSSELLSLAYDGVSYGALVGEAERVLKPLVEESPHAVALVGEGFADAEVANAEYLKRPAIVDGLCYGQSISLIVGGKHAGKSSIARTLAISIVKPEIDVFMGRTVAHGPVLYAASDDEVMVARSELLRMGWKKDDPLELVHAHTDIGSGSAETTRILEQLADRAIKAKALFIVLDMLFDFAGIRDEMQYAGTREASKKIQQLANWTGAHILSTHHAPKYLPETATAATAALGSQGVGARFSPIILARHWGADVYTIESTAARDPRGQALPQYLVELRADGRIYENGLFKAWMKWKLYAPRIMDLLEGGEPGKEWSADAIARQFEIDRSSAQNALYNLWKEGKIQREKKGKGYRYFLAVEQQRDISETNTDQRSWTPD